jgi:hypothetical protein
MRPWTDLDESDSRKGEEPSGELSPEQDAPAFCVGFSPDRKVKFLPTIAK